tara:strand:+ start:192 stop:422 length:231 start_codon:yes stop_codon:yes gene_type:complete
MITKGFAENSTNIETPNGISIPEKPLKSDNNKIMKVDINELKARAQKIKDKENKKNISIFVFFLIIVSAAGIYLSI